MKTENLIEKSIAKAAGRSLNDILSGLSGSMTLEQAKEAVQWAVDERTNDILGDLRSTLEQDMTGPKDQKHTYGFQLAIDLINNNYFE